MKKFKDLIYDCAMKDQRDQVEYDEDRDDERDKRGEQDGTRNS